jgi:hypothetical protein
MSLVISGPLSAAAHLSCIALRFVRSLSPHPFRLVTRSSFHMMWICRLKGGGLLEYSLTYLLMSETP